MERPDTRRAPAKSNKENQRAYRQRQQHHREHMEVLLRNARSRNKETLEKAMQWYVLACRMSAELKNMSARLAAFESVAEYGLSQLTLPPFDCDDLDAANSIATIHEEDAAIAKNSKRTRTRKRPAHRRPAAPDEAENKDC